MLLTVNLVFTILIFLMILGFVIIIVIAGLYLKKNIPKWKDEFDDKKKDMDKHIDKARDEIIAEIQKK